MNDLRRKSPQQRRSQYTVSCILEAAAQLLNQTDMVSVTTNHVAERAGVSIGTLYRYFRDKDDIFIALAHAEIGKVKFKASAILSSNDFKTPQDIFDTVIHITENTFDRRPFVRRNLREFVGSRPTIVDSVQHERILLCQLIERRLLEFDHRLFRMMDYEERLCAIAAWRGVLNSTLEEDAGRFYRHEIKPILTGTLIGCFMRPEFLKYDLRDLTETKVRG